MHTNIHCPPSGCFPSSFKRGLGGLPMNEGLVIGVVIIVAGIVLFFFPPREINSLYGFRTSNSMRNKANWDKANKYCSRLLIIFGIMILIIALVFKSTILNFLALGVSIVLTYILVELKISRV